MKQSKKFLYAPGPLLVAIVLFTLTSCDLSNNNLKENETMEKSKEMSTFIIEREVKNVGNSTSEDLKASSKKSNSVIEKLGPNIKWEQSYIVDDKIYCVYKAKDKSYIKEHAKKVGVPANSIKEVFAITDPQTAE